MNKLFQAWRGETHVAHHCIHARVEHPKATRHGERWRFMQTSVHPQIELERAVGGWNRTNKNKNKPSSKQTSQDKQKRYISTKVRFTNVRYILKQQTLKMNITHQQIRRRRNKITNEEHWQTESIGNPWRREQEYIMHARVEKFHCKPTTEYK